MLDTCISEDKYPNPRVALRFEGFRRNFILLELFLKLGYVSRAKSQVMREAYWNIVKPECSVSYSSLKPQGYTF